MFGTVSVDNARMFATCVRRLLGAVTSCVRTYCSRLDAESRARASVRTRAHSLLAVAVVHRPIAVCTCLACPHPRSTIHITTRSPTVPDAILARVVWLRSHMPGEGWCRMRRRSDVGRPGSVGLTASVRTHSYHDTLTGGTSDVPSSKPLYSGRTEGGMFSCRAGIATFRRSSVPARARRMRKNSAKTSSGHRPPRRTWLRTTVRLSRRHRCRSNASVHRHPPQTFAASSAGRPSVCASGVLPRRGGRMRRLGGCSGCRGGLPRGEMRSHCRHSHCACCSCPAWCG